MIFRSHLSVEEQYGLFPWKGSPGIFCNNFDIYTHVYNSHLNFEMINNFNAMRVENGNLI